MKLKLWQFEYEFTTDDAKIVIPVILLILALTTTELRSEYLIGSATAYYSIYFFAPLIFKSIRSGLQKRRFRCLHCKSKNLILQGYQGYQSDELYAYYLCKDCKTTHVLLENGLVIA